MSKYNYSIPDYITAPTKRFDAAANLTHFLMANGKGIFDEWYGHMRAADQRRLFGKFIGKGLVIIDGGNEWVQHNVTVCFGTMRDTQATYHWRDL